MRMREMDIIEDALRLTEWRTLDDSQRYHMDVSYPFERQL